LHSGGTVWGKAHGFPIKDVGNDTGGLTMSGMTEGEGWGMTEGAIDNVGNDRGKKGGRIDV